MRLAGVAQKMVKILSLDCPPNYACGGPAYAALQALDSILHLMGFGCAFLQKLGVTDTSEYQKFVRKHAVLQSTVVGGLIQHKGQILSGALHAILCDFKTAQFRECPEATENALFSVLEWYF